MMQMSFYQSESVVILFEQWSCSTKSCYFGSLAAIFLAGILSQLIARIQRYYDSTVTRKVCTCQANVKLLSEFDSLVSITNNQQLIRTILYFLNVSLGYMLMLIAMTFNAGVIIALIMGMTVGFFLFSYDTMRSDVHACC